ncbi:hypothetical protein EPUS_08354 [Endocarpon pusillum Z07020]|uniref:PBP domain-containing protein n=1 Tax=Endocarpon pusillum (strain Z07020 / HMAS-L-300199) TaxID=1263415 RepID=U1GG96_ENDPU|nr:uncharacterized protein EPUS_08354 [Endocarpon pusillum Z07020]ERF70796.1 hypothetical protein EPUS_08354 [Endocarpon pusillum Z07020]
MASVKVIPNAPPHLVEPTEIYGVEGPITLRIATGGAGQSGLLRTLAEAFINDFSQQYSSAPESERPPGCVIPFRACWIASDTSASFNNLALNAADVSITYHATAEKIAMGQGVADRRENAWRDHFMLVGPKSNPAKLPVGSQQTVYDLFAQIFCAAIETANSKHPVRYLSRFDKSASNICESKIWITIGQAPWSHPYSTWYHQYIDFPFQSLRIASKLAEYTLVDRGTWYSIEEDVTDSLEIFAEGTDDEDDPLLNSAHALVGAFGANKAMATAFVDWLIKPDGGQKIIKEFAVKGHVLYTTAPERSEA